MAHFALICPPFYSHVRVFETLAAALAARGHRSTFVVNAGAGALVAASGCGVREVHDGGGAKPVDVEAVVRRAARPNGPLGILRTVADTAALTDALCAGAPSILAEIGADAVLGDQMEPAAGLIAARLGLPHVSVAAALPIDRAPGVPLPFLDWPYDPSPQGLRRNRGGDAVADLLLARQRRTIAAWSQRFGLSPRNSLQDCLSPTMTIAQTVPSFDFPRPADPRFHAVGPIRPPAMRGEAPPIALDPARPFVFASLGTLQGHRLGLFQAVAKACRRLGAQLLVAHCGGLTERQAHSVGADAVTDFAPQAAVLARAQACVTHGGMNTVLDALRAGVPLLAIPICFDQPGVAARIVHHGVGEKMSRVLLSSRRVEASLARLLAASSYRDKAALIGRDIEASGGADLAARLIDQAITGQRGQAA